MNLKEIDNDSQLPPECFFASAPKTWSLFLMTLIFWCPIWHGSQPRVLRVPVLNCVHSVCPNQRNDGKTRAETKTEREGEWEWEWEWEWEGEGEEAKEANYYFLL